MNSRVSKTARRPGRPPGGRLIADRSQLLDAAERSIEAHGVDVTMEAIAAEASVTKPILYRTIGDRDALVAALSDRFVERINVAAAVAAGEATTRRDIVLRIIRSFVETVETQPNLFLFVTAGIRNGDGLTRSLSVGDVAAAPLAELLSRLHGGERPPDPLTSLIWARALIGASQYATLWWLRDRSCGAEELAERITDLLWSGIDAGGT